MNLYDAAYLAAMPVIAPVIAYKRMRLGKYRESLPGMLGKRLPARALPKPAAERCWMHSVSVGETVAAGSVYRELKRRELGWEFLCTTTTETGQAQAHQTMAGAEQFSYAPADFSWTVRAFYRAYRPSVYLFFETEIWPNILSEGARRGVPIFLVNGKLSERSARRYVKASVLFRPILSNVRHFFMQTNQDAERMARIVGTEKNISVVGNVKFDALPDPLAAEERSTIRKAWGMGTDDVVALAGSTHPGEEDLVLDAYREAKAKCPALRLVIAPRHPERFDTVAGLIEKQGFALHRTSAGENAAPSCDQVVLLDQMRVLARSFGAAEIALLAGSWAPIGGHNLLEPAVHGIPVLRGPHMHAQPEIVRVLGPGDGAPEVPRERLAGMLIELGTEEAKRRAMGEKAARAANSNRGAAKRAVETIVEMVGEGMERMKDEG